MRGLFLAFTTVLLASPASAHAGLYHALVENPVSVLPAVLVTALIVLIIYLFEQLRKKREK